MAEAGGTGPPSKLGNFWTRRSRRGKIWLIISAVVAVIVLIAALSPSENTAGDGDEAAQPVQPPPPPPNEPAPPPPPEEPPPPPPAPAPRPVTLSGSGARVVSVRLTEDSPAVVTATHRGAANFIVELVAPGGSDLLVNEIGNYRGQVAVEDASAGRYRVRVDADGAWTLRFAQPVPTPRAKPVPGSIAGRGSRVVQIRATEDLQPIVAVRHRGSANFIVELIGYGDTSGAELLINEIGTYAGETLIEDMPQGSYLLAVQADGPWRIRFSP